jgi:hypothetical protein
MFSPDRVESAFLTAKPKSPPERPGPLGATGEAFGPFPRMPPTSTIEV